MHPSQCFVTARAALIREHGAIGHLLVMLPTPVETMGARVWACGLVVVAALSLRIVVEDVLGVPIADSVWLFLFGATVHQFSTKAIGIHLATFIRSVPQFGPSMLLTPPPLQNLSGAVPTRCRLDRHRSSRALRQR